ncbi:MAG TPA: HPr family phosphocarrier protein [Actinomycetales bacterium]
MAERQVAIGSSVGLHARPATVFVQAVQAAAAAVTIARGDGDPVDASSILNVLTLNVGSGDQVTLRADGDDADATLDALVELLQRDLDA